MDFTSIVTPEYCLKHHELLIDELHVALGYEESRFKSFALPALLSLSHFVQALPFLPEQKNMLFGGVQFALNYSISVVKIAQSKSFYPQSKQTVRVELEEQTTFTLFLASLAKTISHIYRHFEVKSGAMIYHPLSSQMSLYDWRNLVCGEQIIAVSERNVCLEYSQSQLGALLSLFIPKGLLTYFSQQVVFDLFTHFVKKEHEASLFSEVLNKAYDLTLSQLSPKPQTNNFKAQEKAFLKTDEKPLKQEIILQEEAKEILKALNALITSKHLQNHYTINEDGVMVKNILLGSLGTSFVQAKAILEESHLVLKAHEKSLLLHPVVKSFLTNEKQ